MRTLSFSVASVILLAAGGAGAETSALWGESGELFDAQGRLMDWSYAGYRYGEAALPSVAAAVNVTDHGATADDGTDDTAAFKAAIAAADQGGGGAVVVPEGTWVISDKLTLPSGIVLQGAGPDATILDIPISLTDLLGNTGLDGGGTSSYSFGQAFIEAKGSLGSTELASVTANAERGDTTLSISGSGLSAGQWVRLQQTDVNGELMARLHSDLLQGGSDNVGDGVDFVNRVVSVDGSTLTLERPLSVDVDTGWSPVLYAFEPNRTEVGVEHLSIRFPHTTYPGHFKEQGYNAIHYTGLAHSWVRNVRITNADYGVNLGNCFFVTVADVVLDLSASRGGSSGHHGLNNGHGGDNLFVGFDIQATYQHDLTNEWYATGIVFTKGRGNNLRMDHHRAAPYTTLWTELHTGAGTSAWVSGGSGNRGPHTASYDTLWNVTADADMDLPADDFGPRMNFIGFRTAATEATSPYDWWLESMAPEALVPANLWQAMVERRLGSPPDAGQGGAGGAPSTGGAAGTSGNGGVNAGGTGVGGSAGPAGGSAGTSAAGSTSTPNAGAAPLGAAPSSEPRAADGGCACRTTRRPSDPVQSGGLVLMLGTVGLLLRRTRGRQSCACPPMTRAFLAPRPA